MARIGPSDSGKGNCAGFSLVEVMVSVGIIGVLISVAVPMFERYRTRSRQAEAKIALSAIYGLEEGFYSEYGAYIPYVDAIGFQPEGEYTYYRTGFENGVWSKGVTTYLGDMTQSQWARTIPVTNLPLPCSFGDVASMCPGPNMDVHNFQDPQRFKACAGGQLRSTATVCDYWQITEEKDLENFSVGI